jgi:hypothetical protein
VLTTTDAFASDTRGHMAAPAGSGWHTKDPRGDERVRSSCARGDNVAAGKRHARGSEPGSVGGTAGTRIGVL